MVISFTPLRLETFFSPSFVLIVNIAETNGYKKRLHSKRDTAPTNSVYKNNLFSVGKIDALSAI